MPLRYNFATMHEMRLVCTIINNELMLHSTPYRLCFTLHYIETVRNLLTGLIFCFFKSFQPWVVCFHSFIHLSVRIVRNKGLARVVPWVRELCRAWEWTWIFVVVLRTNKEDIEGNAFTVFGLELIFCKLILNYNWFWLKYNALRISLCKTR